MPGLVRHRSNNSGRLHSHGVWHSCPSKEVVEQEYGGHWFFDDFRGMSAITLNTESGQYFINGDTGGTVTKTADTDHGQIELATDGTDEDGILVCHGNAAGWARFGPSDRVWFEGRYAPESVGDTTVSSFLGFIEVNVVPTGDITIVDSTGVLDASEDFIGWRTILGNGDFWEPIYQEGAATLQAVGTGVDAATGAGYAGAVAADTMAKWGLTWDGVTLKFFKNGAKVAYYTPTSADSFPDTNHLAMIIAGKAHTAAARKWYLDWWQGVAYTVE